MTCRPTAAAMSSPDRPDAMPATLTIEAAGPGTTIQDAGRFALLRFGVTPAGPMDWASFKAANLALGNDPGAAAIEVTLGGLVLSTDRPVCLAFAGGGFIWTRDGQVLPEGARVRLRPGERLRAKAGAWGAFTYCAVPGGVDVAPVMGSRATHLRSKLGGLRGRALQGDDRLSTAQSGEAAADDIEIAAQLVGPRDAPIRIMLGPQDDHFTAAGLTTLTGTAFRLSAQADRMAYRFEGSAIEHNRDHNIVSDGIALGAIQVAGDGLPMVLMADRQPTGGYPKIAHVIRADIGRLAQMRTGDSCRFAKVDWQTARAALLKLDERASGVLRHAKPLRLVPTADRLRRENLIGGVTDGGAGD